MSDVEGKLNLEERRGKYRLRSSDLEVPCFLPVKTSPVRKVAMLLPLVGHIMARILLRVYYVREPLKPTKSAYSAAGGEAINNN